MKKLQTRKSQTSQRFQRLIFSTARPTGSVGQEHNLQKKTISKLSQHAKTATQNVYQAYTKGMQTKLSFLTRTSHDMEEYLQEPEKQLCWVELWWQSSRSEQFKHYRGQCWSCRMYLETFQNMKHEKLRKKQKLRYSKTVVLIWKKLECSNNFAIIIASPLWFVSRNVLGTSLIHIDFGSRCNDT